MGSGLNGQLFKKMIFNAAAIVENNRQVLNELNVFPVPDGDTGINMSMTLNAAAKALSDSTEINVGPVASTAAASLLRGARGNSGVILSLLFRGFAKRLSGIASASELDFSEALEEGVAAAYKAVMNPTEGTILTVSRKASIAATSCAKSGKPLEEVLNCALDEAKVALSQTVEQNPVLKKAGVVDAGAKGYVLILEGMLYALRGDEIKPDTTSGIEIREKADFSEFDDKEITFLYCTEYIVSRSGTDKDPIRLRAFLESIGDSVVVVDDAEIIKVHVHTNNPGLALEEGIKFGSLSSMKIENMREQHANKVIETKREGVRTFAPPEKTFGFVVCAAGEGVCSLYLELGADQIVMGGQTMNPSTEDILSAIDSTPAEIVFVLPNNKNIILAAEQTVVLTEKKVVVIPSKSIPQGISAMLAFDTSMDAGENISAMKTAIAGVRTGLVTYAARDSEFDGRRMKAGDYLCLLENKLDGSGKHLESVMRHLLRSMKVRESSFITLFCGKDSRAEDNIAIEALIRKEAGPAVEFNVIDGGQPIYYYMISAE